MGDIHYVNANQYVDNTNRKVYNIDFDGTLTDGSSYSKLVPNRAMISKVRELYFLGHIIIIWSARLWEDARDVVAFCIGHSIPFHGLMLGKGGTDVYVDDKAVNSNDFLKEEF